MSEIIMHGPKGVLTSSCDSACIQTIALSSLKTGQLIDLHP